MGQKNTHKNMRRLAADILAEIERGKNWNEACRRLEGVCPRDAALIRAIIFASLRHYGEIGEIVSRYIKKPIPKRPHKASALLYNGVAQLLYLDMPPHAVLNETLNAVARAEQPYRGMLNAVLRNIARDRPTPHPVPFINLPDWVAQTWRMAYGDAIAQDIARSHYLPPPLDIVFKTAVLCDKWCAQNTGTRLSATAVRLYDAPAVPEIDGFDTGIWWVQDIAASLPAHFVPYAECVLDLCAAPGGKTLQLAARNMQVTAVDISSARLLRLTENLTRCGLAADIVTADIVQWSPAQRWPTILLDAPCSATGTLRRHPDIALVRKKSDIAKLVPLQDALLDKAAHLLASGGCLVYCTCSLDPREGEERISAFLHRHKAFSLYPILPDEVPSDFHAACQTGMFRTLPTMLADKGGCDGFFAARLIKK